MKVEKATIEDVKKMHELVNKFAGTGEMLPRALSEIYENLRDYFVIRDTAGVVIACVALHISWSDLAEVKALAVHESKHKKGMGAALIKACVREDSIFSLLIGPPAHPAPAPPRRNRETWGSYSTRPRSCAAAPSSQPV